MVAKFDGETVTADEFKHRDISDENLCADTVDSYLTCPTSGYRLTHISESSDGRIPHFRYCPDTPEGGRVGQTETHMQLVRESVAASEVDKLLSSVTVCNTIIESGGYEARVSDKDSREPDIILEFEERDSQLGDGLIIEVQVSNENKNVALTTADYLRFEEDYSVLWLSDKQFYTEPDTPRDWKIDISNSQQLRHKTISYDRSVSDFLAIDCEKTPDSKSGRRWQLATSIRFHPGISTTELSKLHDWHLEVIRDTLYNLKEGGEIEQRDENGSAWHLSDDTD
jgi:hypothetical protein